MIEQRPVLSALAFLYKVHSLSMKEREIQKNIFWITMQVRLMLNTIKFYLPIAYCQRETTLNVFLFNIIPFF